ESLVPEISIGHSGQRFVQRRHHRADDDAVDFTRLKARKSEKLARENAVLVHSLISGRGESPVGDEIVLSKNSQDGVCITGIERQEHYEASVTSPERT